MYNHESELIQWIVAFTGTNRLRMIVDHRKGCGAWLIMMLISLPMINIISAVIVRSIHTSENFEEIEYVVVWWLCF